MGVVGHLNIFVKNIYIYHFFFKKIIKKKIFEVIIIIILILCGIESIIIICDMWPCNNRDRCWHFKVGNMEVR
jgi:hypothetical protein